MFSPTNSKPIDNMMQTNKHISKPPNSTTKIKPKVPLFNGDDKTASEIEPSISHQQVFPMINIRNLYHPYHHHHYYFRKFLHQS